MDQAGSSGHDAERKNKVREVLDLLKKKSKGNQDNTAETEQSSVQVEEAVVAFFLDECEGNAKRAADLLMQQLRPQGRRTQQQGEGETETEEEHEGPRRDHVTSVVRRRGGPSRREEGGGGGDEGAEVGRRGPSSHPLSVRRAVAAVVFLCFRTLGRAATLSARTVRGTALLATGTARLVFDLVVPRPLARWLNRLVSLTFSGPASSRTTVLDPAEAASLFAHRFQQDYVANAEDEAEGGPSFLSPSFEVCSYYEALGRARQRGRFLMCFLHSASRRECRSFCSSVLSSREVASFLNDTFVVWGGEVTESRDAYRLARSLGVTRYPAIAVLTSESIVRDYGGGGAGVLQGGFQGHGGGSGMALVVLSQGEVSAEALTSLLRGVVEESGAMLVAARAEQQERENSRRIREEQERDFAAALEEDRRRDRERQAVAEEERRAEEEEERRARREEEKRIEVERRRSRGSAGVPLEPGEAEEGVCVVMVRLPCGTRRQRRFRESDVVGALYHYVDSLEENTAGAYKLVTNFPRRVFGQEDKELTLKEAGLAPQAALFLQSEDD